MRRNYKAVFFISTCLLMIVIISFSLRNLSEEYLWRFSNAVVATDSTTIDSLEFAPHLSAREQVLNAPDARYKKGHKLLPNVLWMSPRYLGGAGQGASTSKIIEESTAIMKTLAERMNYYLILPGNTYGITGYNDTTTVAGAYIDLANKNPHLPASVIIFWAQIRPEACGYKKNYPAIFRTDFPDSYYIHFDKKKRLSPASPDDSLISDGRVMRCYLEKLCANLRRPVQLVNENGEVFKLFGKSLLEKDPHVAEDKRLRKIEDWSVYEASRRAEKEKIVRQQFMDLPCLKNALYTQYAIDGQRTYRHRYEETRTINSRINGQYYSTPDFYPRWPSNWKNWKGAWHGFKWIAECRNVEIQNGDDLYSPFVSAGWDHREEQNIRPGQWLGLLKALGVTGAEFYYTGFFSLKAPFPKPENYVWQSLMPAYAQGVTSHYEDILRDSKLLNEPGYNLSTVNDELIVARKSNKAEIYVVSGTIQPSDNKKGSAPLERITEIKLNNKRVHLKIRRQGSTYIIDLSRPEPLIIQLDEWHEYMHPNKWKTGELTFEAELYEDNKRNCITEDLASIHDFSTFTTFVQLEKDALEIRPALPRNVKQMNAWIRVKGKNGSINVVTDEKETSKIIDSETWQWIKAGQIINNNNNKLKLTGKNVSVDKIRFLETDIKPAD